MVDVVLIVVHVAIVGKKLREFLLLFMDGVAVMVPRADALHLETYHQGGVLHLER
jgi:hypothetical protein